MPWKNARIDEEVHQRISKVGKFGESVNDVLRRLLEMPPRTAEKPGPKEKVKPNGLTEQLKGHPGAKRNEESWSRRARK